MNPFACVVGIASLWFALNPSQVSAQSDGATPARLAVVRDSLLRASATASGIVTTVVTGSPGAAGQRFEMMIRIDSGRWIAPHTHPVPKDVHVLHGTLLLGHGDAVDAAGARAHGVGEIVAMPAAHAHYEGAKGTTVLLLRAIGPFSTSFIPRPTLAASRLAPATATSAPVFTRVTGVRELRDGRVMVADAAEPQLYLMPPDLMRHTPHGRTGRGPREYASIEALLDGRADSTILVDMVGGRLLHIGPGGELGRTETLVLESSGFTMFPRVRAVDQSGSYYYPGTRGGLRSALDRDSIPILRRRMGRANADTVGWVRIPATRVGSSASGNDRQLVRALPDPFAWRDDWAVTVDGRVAIVRGDTYRTDWFHDGRRVAAGQPLRVPAIPVTDADLRRVAESATGTRGSSGFGDGTPAGSVSATKPPFVSGTVLRDPLGRIWAARSRAANVVEVTYDIFGGDGNHVATIAVGARARVVGFGRRTVYVVTPQDDDLFALSRHPLP
jgi:hypothetical protein